MIRLAQLARFPALRLNDSMRGGTTLILVGVAAIVAYSVGRQNVPSSGAPVAVMTSSPTGAKPMAFNGPVGQSPAPVPTQNPNSPTPSVKADSPDKPARPDTKRK